MSQSKEYKRDWHKRKMASDPEYREKIRKQRLDTYHRTKTPESIRDRNLRKRFGLTSEQYEQRFQDQRGLCAICKRPEHRTDKHGEVMKLSVDHDHQTETLRDLLCGDCNIAIGLMCDDVLRLREAIEYINRHRSPLG